MAITFTVAGDPVPQPRPKISTIGGRGRAYVVAKHPIHAYRQSIALTAKAAGATPTDAAPLTLEIDLVMVRPKSHYKASGELNPRTALKVPQRLCKASTRIVKATPKSTPNFIPTSARCSTPSTLGSTP